LQILSGINTRARDFFTQNDVQNTHLCSFNATSVHLRCLLITLLNTSEKYGKLVYCWKFSSSRFLYIYLKLLLRLTAFVVLKPSHTGASLPCSPLIVCKPFLLHMCFCCLTILASQSSRVCFYFSSSSTYCYCVRSYAIRKPGRLCQPKICQEKM